MKVNLDGGLYDLLRRKDGEEVVAARCDDGKVHVFPLVRHKLDVSGTFLTEKRPGEVPACGADRKRRGPASDEDGLCDYCSSAMVEWANGGRLGKIKEGSNEH